MGFNIYCFALLCLVYPVLPVSLNCSFFIAFSIFCNIYLTWKLSIDNDPFQQHLPLEYISQLLRYSSTCGSYHDFRDKALLLTTKPHMWCNYKRARVQRLRSARFTPKTIKLVCVVSPLIMHRKEERATHTLWLRIIIMCPCGVTNQPLDCFFSELVLLTSN